MTASTETQVKRRRGRPPGTGHVAVDGGAVQNVIFVASLRLVAALDAASAKDGVARSEWIRRTLEAALKQ